MGSAPAVAFAHQECPLGAHWGKCYDPSTTQMRAPARARAAAIGAILAAAAGCAVSASPPNLAPAAATAAAHVLASYRAPLGCPTQREYLDYVASRAVTLQLLPEAQVESALLDGATRVRVRIQPDSASAGWIGALRIEGAQALEREVRGERCQDVAQALALITVLRLDERAGEAPGAQPSAAAGRVGAESQSVEPAPAAPLSGAAAGASAPAAAAVPEAVTAPAQGTLAQDAPAQESSAAQAEAAAASATAAAAAASAAVSAAAAAAETTAETATAPVAAMEPATPEPAATTASVAAAPVVALAPVAGGVAAPERPLDVGAPARQQRGSELQPVLVAQAGYAAAPSHALQAQLLGELRLGAWVAGLGAGYAAASDANSEADLDFQLFTAQLSLCPLGGELSVFWWRACAELEGGALRVSVSARDPSLETQASTRPWFALGPSLQAGWSFARQWALRGAAGGSLMLVRDRFEVKREEGGELRVEYNTLYRPPPLSFDLLLGVGYAF
jgi:hypothetical protein